MKTGDIVAAIAMAPAVIIIAVVIVYHIVHYPFAAALAVAGIGFLYGVLYFSE